MTEQRTEKAARRGSGPAAAGDSRARESGTRDTKRRRPAFLPTVLVALACFGVTFEFLALQLQSGRDPALSVSAASAPAKVRPKRKIIITRVIAAAGGNTAPTSSSTGASVAAPAPVTTATS